MQIPNICTKSASFDREDAGWYTPRSTIVHDIRPDWRLFGGGVTSSELTDLHTAIDKAISYTKEHIYYAEEHLRKLEKAKADLIA